MFVDHGLHEDANFVSVQGSRNKIRVKVVSLCIFWLSDFVCSVCCGVPVMTECTWFGLEQWLYPYEWFVLGRVKYIQGERFLEQPLVRPSWFNVIPLILGACRRTWQPGKQEKSLFLQNLSGWPQVCVFIFGKIDKINTHTNSCLLLLGNGRRENLSACNTLELLMCRLFCISNQS